MNNGIKQLYPQSQTDETIFNSDNLTTMQENNIQLVTIPKERVLPALATATRAFYQYFKSETFLELDDADRVDEAWNMAETLNQIANLEKQK